MKALLYATVLCKTSATVVESLTPLPTSAFAKSAKVTESLGALLYDTVRCNVSVMAALSAAALPTKADATSDNDCVSANCREKAVTFWNTSLVLNDSCAGLLKPRAGRSETVAVSCNALLVVKT